jgi:aspartyl/asparaginyl-tRNA synthetase
MSFFEYIKVKLLTLRPDQPATVLHESFARSESELASYRSWLGTREKEQMLSYIYQEYRLSKAGQEDPDMIKFLKKPNLQGFTLRYPESMLALHFQHLHDYFKDKVIELGYYTTLSERRIIPRSDFTENIDRYKLNTLRPGEDLIREGSKNYFGTVFIDLYRIEEHPTHLKFFCSYPTPKDKGIAPSFDLLLAHICG